MDPFLQLDPERCICVLGPQVTAQCLEAVAGNGERVASPHPALSYKGLVELGVRKVLEVEAFASSEERARRETLLMNTYELEPCFAANKVAESLRVHRVFEPWVTQIFSTLQQTARKSLSSHPTIKRLQALQEKGLRLAYSHYDTVLASALGEQPVLLENEDGVKRWYLNSRTSGGGGLLYLHGLCTLPSTLKWDCVAYPSAVADSTGAQVLKEICKSKMVVFLGFDEDFFDPFLPKFAAAFCDSQKAPPLLLSLHPQLPSGVSTVRGFLNLPLQHGLNLERVTDTPPLKSAMSGLTFDPSAPIDVVLLYLEHNTCLGAADKVKNLPTVRASNLKITQDTVHRLSMTMDRSSLHNLWVLMLADGSPLQPGLVGVSIDRSLTVWLTGGGNSRTLGHAANAGRPDLSTLNTSLSVISSMWTPITSPAVTKLSPSNRPVLPSPLVCVTSRALQKGASAPELLKPNRVHVLQKGVSNPELKPPPVPGVRRVVYNPATPQKSHQQPRRVQSEHDKLTYQDRVGDAVDGARSSKNRMLLHRESAPTFLYTPDGIVPYLSATFQTGVTAKAISVPKPSPLMNIDNSMNEHRIEYIDQYKQQRRMGNGSGVAVAKKVEVRAAPADGEKQDERKSSAQFDELRRKYIEDARQWSRKLEKNVRRTSEMVIASGSPASVHTATASIPSGGLRSAKDVGKMPSLLLPSGAVASAEDQEKMLRQHFEQTAAAIAAATPRMSTHSSSLSPPSSSTIQLSPSPGGPATSPNRLGSHRSPRPSPIQVPTSPRNSPLHPFLLGGHTTAASGGVFTYLPSNPSLQSPAGFVYSPPVFNPYQAAMQMLPQQGGAKQQHPFLVTDPSILQSFQSMFGDKLLCLLPDGSIANFPITTSGANQATMASNTSTSPAKHEPAVSPIKLPKRSRSPEVEGDIRDLPFPKRRRSSSLPDISQLSSEKRGFKGAGDERMEEEEEEGQGVESVTVDFQGLKPREAQPPNMIQIPKVNDPMFGFPTPPHGSPLPSSHLSISPLIQMGFPTQPLTPVTPSQEAMTSEEIKELVEAAGSQPPVPPSPEGSSLPPFPAGRGPIQLWQFLLDLLLSPDKAHMIMWTGNGYEFRILQPEEIAKLWGARKNKPKMNYDKLSRGLRYYYSKGIMDKVPGKKLTFKYTCNVQHYVNSRGSPIHPVRGFNGQATVVAGSADGSFSS